MQLDFFDDSVEELRNTDGIERRVCKKCNQEKLFTDFHTCDNKKFRRRICKSCYNKETHWRDWNRHKHIDKKTGKCDCCGKEEDKIAASWGTSVNLKPKTFIDGLENISLIT